MSVPVCAVTGSAGRTRKCRKESGKCPNSLTDQFRLNRCRKKALSLRFVRVPILESNPGHPPMNVWRSRLPKLAKQCAVLSCARQVPLHGPAAEMGGSVQCRVENPFRQAIPVCLQKPWPMPAVRQSASQRKKMNFSKVMLGNFLEVEIGHNEVHSHAGRASGFVAVTE